MPRRRKKPSDWPGRTSACPSRVTEGIVAQQEQPSELVTLQDLAVSNAYEITALVAVLERKGILKQQEVLGEIARLKERTGKPR